MVEDPASINDNAVNLEALTTGKRVIMPMVNRKMIFPNPIIDTSHIACCLGIPYSMARSVSNELSYCWGFGKEKLLQLTCNIHVGHKETKGVAQSCNAQDVKRPWFKHRHIKDPQQHSANVKAEFLPSWFVMDGWW
jgi:hypothetical protein